MASPPSGFRPTAPVKPLGSQSGRWRGPAGDQLWGRGATAPPAPAGSMEGRTVADLRRRLGPKQRRAAGGNLKV
ncbi:MAG: hypothetical protein KME26_03350 [Oscillatoria princeps RMCB-10]|nr:hypothetical protein [Oscillatoria princeps RMCB-10]